MIPAEKQTPTEWGAKPRVATTLRADVDDYIIADICRRFGLDEQAFRAAYTECVKRKVQLPEN